MHAILRKSAVASLATAPVFLLAPFVPLAALLAAPIAAGIAAFAWFNHRRIHPDHERYLKQENTQFAVPDRSYERATPKPAQRLLTKGNE